jgi:SAM-dependent methyltransferase
MPWGDRWLTAVWPFVRSQLPPAPASVLEIGCGPLGGFVPRMAEQGYEAAGIDRNAPDAPGYHQLDFEHHDPPLPVDAIVASRSLHHVGDVGDVIARAAATLRPGGTIVVAEWAWGRFDEQTARWCFDRLDAPEDEPGWLHRRRDGWLASGEAWDAYFTAWTRTHELQSADLILRELDRHFERALCEYAPYFFADLGGTSEDDEQAAIDVGEIRATGIRYAGTLRSDV